MERERMFERMWQRIKDDSRKDRDDKRKAQEEKDRLIKAKADEMSDKVEEKKSYWCCFKKRNKR